MKIGFIGAGNLATALIRGSSCTDFFKNHEFFAYDIYKPNLDSISSLGVTPLTSTKNLVEVCDIVILAVKPKDFPKLLQENSQSFISKDPLIVSVAAGTEIAYIKSLLGYNARLARIMPNINAQVGGSATAVCVEDSVTDIEKETLLDFCRSFGGVFEINEDMFSVFGVIGGCSPAFNYMYIDQLARAAVKLGMPKAMALDIAAQSVKGSAEMVLSTDNHPYELIDKVCSPGGTTIEGVVALQKNGFENAVNSAVLSAYDKDCKMREKK